LAWVNERSERVTADDRIELREWLGQRGIDWTRQPARHVPSEPLVRNFVPWESGQVESFYESFYPPAARQEVPEEWLPTEIGNKEEPGPGFTFHEINFDLRGEPTANLTRAFMKYLKGKEPEREAGALIWQALIRMSRVKWRYLLRDRMVSEAALHRICDVVVDELLKFGCIVFPSPVEDTRTRIVHCRVDAYGHQRSVAIARLPADEVKKRERDDWILNSKAPNPEYNPLAIAPEAVSTGRSRRVMRVPWVDDEGAWRGGRRPA
jgi:hypothetical protein